MMTALHRTSITNFITNRPIIFSILFIVIFDTFIKYHPKIFLLVLAAYFVLKGFGLSYYIKLIIDFFYEKLFNILDTKKINVIDEDEYGNIQAIFTFKHNFKKYIVKVNKNSEKCVLVLYLYSDMNSNKKLTTIETNPFNITEESVVNKIMDVYFN